MLFSFFKSMVDENMIKDPIIPNISGLVSKIIKSHRKANKISIYCKAANLLAGYI